MAFGSLIGSALPPDHIPKSPRRRRRKSKRRWPHWAGWLVVAFAAVIWLWNRHREPIIVAALERLFSFIRAEDA